MSKNCILLSFTIPILAFLLIGCGNQEPETMPPEAVAEKFVSSLTRKDLETACAVTLPALRETIATNLEAYSPATASDFPVRIGKVRRSKNHATVQVQLVFPSRVNTDELVLVQTNGQWLVESL
ncbi:MAG: nuclear transport factor 2 family protein [Kiritimatiellae bacterium]|nr:nuclear transport factor 2 family protein [Kiritimatiellia bacterium]